MSLELTPGKDPVEPELDPGFEVIGGDAVASPLVFSSPHSGDVYPRNFLNKTRLTLAQLRRSEDAFVDALFDGCLTLGAPMIRARFPRTYLDLNREPYELDPRMFEGRLPAHANTRSIRVAGGLGAIPRVVGGAQEIYSARFPVEEGLARIETLHKPYHRRLAELLERAERLFGFAVLIDCHSMPSGVAAPPPRRPEGPPELRTRADFVIGDRHGASCAGFLVDAVETQLRNLGFTVARNKPYAGGYITEHYGRPAANRHAMQIEISRSLYMDEQAVVPSARFDDIRAALGKTCAALATAAARLSPQRDAAE